MAGTNGKSIAVYPIAAEPQPSRVLRSGAASPASCASLRPRSRLLQTWRMPIPGLEDADDADDADDARFPNSIATSAVSQQSRLLAHPKESSRREEIEC